MAGCLPWHGPRMKMKTKKTIANVGEILENHIKKTVNKKTVTLNQVAPEIIAEKLKLKERLKKGFKSSERSFIPETISAAVKVPIKDSTIT